ncbi:hypothetical protein GCM10025790_08060 [Nesterenkonia rhizosphaerae]|uniref:Glycosyltransferase 2-like domain-containing protein n=2 Tax=Nesterenkonia rhizosphaerae TaxID=1348272 RepID=A0ABP9FTC9_9MICC
MAESAVRRAASRTRKLLMPRTPLLPVQRRSVRPSSGAPLVTVGITTHQDAERIIRCLTSVAEQTLGAQHIEVLVVDDGSTDQTVRLATNFEQRADWAAYAVRRHRNTGSPSKGRNTILDEARGEYVFFLDADDYLGPQALEAMTEAGHRQRAEVIVGRYVGVNRSAPNVLPPKNPKDAGDYHAGWLNSLHVQKLFRTEFLRRLPYRFNESLIYASDHPFMVSAFLHATTVALVEDVDCYFITLDPPEVQPRVNVSRADIPAVQQLRFLHDCFGLMALARGQNGELAKRAGRMRADYWNRLLKLHIPVLILRKGEDDDAVVKLAHQAQVMAELYGAVTSRTRLVPEAQIMLEALTAEAADAVRAAAHRARGSSAAAPEGAGLGTEST